MNFDEVRSQLKHLSTAEGLSWVGLQFGPKAKYSSALGIEDQVITHLIARQNLPIEIFTLDTGRLFQESYDLLDVTRTKYKISIKTYFPNNQQVEKLLTEKGPNSFYNSVENRKECCFIRKVEPLKRALEGTAVWITGIRSEQSTNRGQMELVEWDDQHKVIKYNPLLNWSEQEVSKFVEENKVPVNTLHKKGFPSIGCAPCTRAIADGEDPRAGRWWWEATSKECGLHETKEEVKAK
jgi:phosphoadenosine phosphosulfate reductase